MHDNKGKKEEDCKHANNDANKARFKLFKKLHLQMFHEETKALKVFVKPQRCAQYVFGKKC